MPCMFVRVSADQYQYMNTTMKSIFVHFECNSQTGMGTDPNDPAQPMHVHGYAAQPYSLNPYAPIQEVLVLFK